MNAPADRRSDDELLAATAGGEPDAFGVFYTRHVAAVVALFLRRTASAELAADLTAETFAAALLGARRFRLLSDTLGGDGGGGQRQPAW